eukprot:11619787-Heterocapsa_arctica.AAC.1
MFRRGVWDQLVEEHLERVVVLRLEHHSILKRLWHELVHGRHERVVRDFAQRATAVCELLVLPLLAQPLLQGVAE